MAYREAILADSPAGYYRLDEASGSTFADSSGNSNTLTISSATGFSYAQSGLLTGDVNTAVKKTGTGSFTGTVASPPSYISGGVSLEGWFKYSGSLSGVTQQGYFIFITAGSYSWSVYLYSSSSGQPLQIRTSFNRADHYISGVVVPDTSYFLTIVFDNNYLDVYLDNVRHQHIARTDSYASAVSVFHVLGHASIMQNVILDEFAFYNRALTPTEIATHYGYGNGDLIDPHGDSRPIMRPHFNPTAHSIFSRGL